MPSGSRLTWRELLAQDQEGREGEARVGLVLRQGQFEARRRRVVAAPPAVVYQAFARLGGARGWLYANSLWQLRGFLDRLVGGPGMSRGRTRPEGAQPGDVIDFWRVERVEPGTLLRLCAEMKVPGPAWLQFEAHPLAQTEGTDAVQTELLQVATFLPDGVFGWLYWYALFPIHSVIFSGLIQKLAEQAEEAFRWDQATARHPM